MRRLVGLGVTLAMLSGSAAPVAFADESGLEQALIESASTPKQHAALASYYEGKAADARKAAEYHRAMGKAYSGGKETQLAAMRDHCEKIAAAYDSQAKEFQAMADMHRSVAK